MKSTFLTIIALFLFTHTVNAQISRGIASGTTPTACSPTGNNVWVDTSETPPVLTRCRSNNKYFRETLGGVNAQTGTSYTFVRSDGNKLVTFNNASAVAATLPQATSGGDFPNTWTTVVTNLGAGTVTITPTTSTINGAASLTVAQGEGAMIFSNGTNYAALKVISAAAGGTVTTTGTPSSGNLTQFSGPSSVTNGDLSGDVTTAGALTTTISNDAVTYSKMQNVTAASRLLGRGDSGSGDPQEITLGTNLSMSGTTLNASGGGGTNPTSTVIPYNNAGTFADSPLFREDANTIAQRNGTTDQKFNLYDSFSDASNYRRLSIFTDASNEFNIASEFAGSGTRRRLNISSNDLDFYTSGSQRWRMDTSGHWLSMSHNNLDLGQVSNAPRRVFAATGFCFNSTVICDSFGTGSPEGVLSASVGSVYRRTDGGASTTLYVKESGTGNTGWISYGAGGGGANPTSTVIPYNNAGTFADSPLFREDANTIAQRNGTTGQAFHVYRTFTSSTSYERMSLGPSGVVFQMLTNAGSGGGSLRSLQIGGSTIGFMTGSSSLSVAWEIGSTVKNLIPGSDGVADIGDNSHKLRNIRGLFNPTYTDASFTKTGDTTLANVTGLSRAVENQKLYYFEANLFFDADATGGHKYAINASGATPVTISYHIQSICDSTSSFVITSRQTTNAGSAGQAGCTAGHTRITGHFKAGANGNLTVQFAQNASSGSSSILINSTFKVELSDN